MSGSPIAPAPADLAANDQVYVGRQPVFDRNRKAVAYQLLHRSSTLNNSDPSMNASATRELVEHSLLQWGLDQLLGGVPGHIRVDAEFLASGLHLTLPSDRVALEFAEDVDIEGTHKFAVIDAKLAGFTVVLSDVLARDHLPRPDLLRLADIMKVDVSTVSVDVLPAALAELRAMAPHARLMAVKVEEIEQFQHCLALGFDLFQGFFFAKPEVLSKAGRSVTSTAAIALLVEVQRPDVSLKRLEELVIADPTLAYRLLALVNSSAVGLSTRVESVYHALVLLGVERVRQMATLITMANRSKGNEEVLLLAATRAHMARALIDVPDLANAAYTAGLLSVIDVLFRVAMEELVTELPLAPVVADALRDGTGPVGEVLRALDAYERVVLGRLEELRPGQLARFITVYRDGAVAAQVLRAQLAGGCSGLRSRCDGYPRVPEAPERNRPMDLTPEHDTGERVDVITLLLQQHDLIRDLFEQVELATPSTRGQAFEPLVRLLAVHETGEEIVVHPALRTCGLEGDAVADARVTEEDAAKTMLAELERMDASSHEFMVAFEELRSAVLRHAELEEREEFPLLVRAKDIDDLQGMATRIKVAESLAPTHAHARAPESATGNLLTGPFLSIVDRVRDLIRDNR